MRWFAKVDKVLSTNNAYQHRGKQVYMNRDHQNYKRLLTDQFRYLNTDPFSNHDILVYREFVDAAHQSRLWVSIVYYLRRRGKDVDNLNKLVIDALFDATEGYARRAGIKDWNDKMIAKQTGIKVDIRGSGYVKDGEAVRVEMGIISKEETDAELNKLKELKIK